MENSIYLGKGIVFPIQLTGQGLPVISNGADLIKSSIFMILSCPTKQRILLPEFGSRLEEVLEEPNDDLLTGLAKHFIVDSLSKWEPRIRIIDVSIERLQEASLDIRLQYQVKISGIEDVLTFPFYKTRNI
jgi:phage baseplate assembly protein W